MNKAPVRLILFNKELVVHVLIWALYFSAINVAWTADWFDPAIRPNRPAPLSVLAFPVFFYLNAYWLIPRYLKGKTWYRYFLLAAVVALAPELIRALLMVTLRPAAGPFVEALLTEMGSRDSWFLGAPSPVWYAFLFSSAYRFTRDWMTHTRRIEKLEKERLTMELDQLKAQINPHFLFNNLNALDDLIDRDKELAKAYLHKLSNLYRYTIMSSGKDVVSLREEWNFIDDYIFLLEERYGGAYQFEKTNELADLTHYLIPPAALQGLLENVVKHNQGSPTDPLLVAIVAGGAGIRVSHRKVPKEAVGNSLGTGLRNLRARYRLLTNQDIVVDDSQAFTVILPLIKRIA